MKKNKLRELAEKKKLKKKEDEKLKGLENEKLMILMGEAEDIDTVMKIQRTWDDANGRKKRPPIDPNTIITAGAMLGGVGLIGLIEHNVGPISVKMFNWLTSFKKGGKGSV